MAYNHPNEVSAMRSNRMLEDRIERTEAKLARQEELIANLPGQSAEIDATKSLQSALRYTLRVLKQQKARRGRKGDST